MFHIIKPGSKIDFIGKQKVFTTISIIMVMASIVSLIIFGFNLDIDFKGGSKMIVAFNEEAHVDKGALKDEVKKIVAGISKDAKVDDGGSVLVQDFEAGAAAESKKNKYLIYTEITTLLNEQTITSIKEKFKAKYGTEAVLEHASEEDKFFLRFPNNKPVLGVYGEVKGIFKELGYEDMIIKSQKEEEVDIEFYKQLNLEESDQLKVGAGAGVDWKLKTAEFQLNKSEKVLPTLQDDTYTITILALNSIFENKLKQRFQGSGVTIEQSTTVSSSVGNQMFNEGLLAILYAIIGILIYISLRFDVRFAPGAVVALIHDVMITMGIFSVFQIKFSLPIVAALLTIVGYSLNDTIVVFDRIRENMEKVKASISPTLINRSINETLGRTFMTSITTLLVVASVLVLGGGLIKNFSLALLIGIVVGTYSSIFIASPLALYINKFVSAKNI